MRVPTFFSHNPQYLADYAKRTRRFVAGTFLITLVGFALASAASAAVQPVSIQGRVTPTNAKAYSPDPVQIQQGDSITWKNNDTTTPALAHTATGAAFDTGQLSPGDTSKAIKFETAGTFPYRCSNHAEMTGSVTVNPAPSPPPSPVPSPSPSPAPSPSPSPSPAPSPSPSPARSPTPSPQSTEPTTTVVAQPLEDERDEGGGMSTPAKVAIGALILAGLAGGGLYWMHRSSTG
jgi:plastocyanin